MPHFHVYLENTGGKELFVFLRVVRIKVRGQKIQHRKLISPETRQRGAQSVIQMIRNTTYLL